MIDFEKLPRYKTLPYLEEVKTVVEKYGNRYIKALNSQQIFPYSVWFEANKTIFEMFSDLNIVSLYDEYLKENL